MNEKKTTKFWNEQEDETNKILDEMKYPAEGTLGDIPLTIEELTNFKVEVEKRYKQKVKDEFKLLVDEIKLYNEENEYWTFDKVMEIIQDKINELGLNEEKQ